jgi:hypothetical protein
LNVKEREREREGGFETNQNKKPANKTKEDKTTSNESGPKVIEE